MNAGFSLLLVLAVAAPPAAQEDVRRLPSALSTAVLVDVVVRDGKDRPVKLVNDNYSSSPRCLTGKCYQGRASMESYFSLLRSLCCRIQ